MHRRRRRRDSTRHKSDCISCAPTTLPLHLFLPLPPYHCFLIWIHFLLPFSSFTCSCNYCCLTEEIESKLQQEKLIKKLVVAKMKQKFNDRGGRRVTNVKVNDCDNDDGCEHSTKSVCQCGCAHAAQRPLSDSLLTLVTIIAVRWTWFQKRTYNSKCSQHRIGSGAGSNSGGGGCQQNSSFKLYRPMPSRHRRGPNAKHCNTQSKFCICMSGLCMIYPEQD